MHCLSVASARCTPAWVSEGGHTHRGKDPWRLPSWPRQRSLVGTYEPMNVLGAGSEGALGPWMGQAGGHGRAHSGSSDMKYMTHMNQILPETGAPSAIPLPSTPPALLVLRPRSCCSSRRAARSAPSCPSCLPSTSRWPEGGRAASRPWPRTQTMVGAPAWRPVRADGRAMRPQASSLHSPGNPQPPTAHACSALPTCHSSREHFTPLGRGASRFPGTSTLRNAPHTLPRHALRPPPPLAGHESSVHESIGVLGSMEEDSVMGSIDQQDQRERQLQQEQQAALQSVKAASDGV